MRNSINYNLFTNQAANGTSAKKILVSDFRHIGVQISTSNTAFTGTIKIKGSRVEDGENIDFTAASTQDNPWSYLQLINNATGASIEGSDGVVLTAESNGTENVAVNVDGFNYITAELTDYTAGDVSTDLALYDNG